MVPTAAAFAKMSLSAHCKPTTPRTTAAFAHAHGSLRTPRHHAPGKNSPTH